MTKYRSGLVNLVSGVAGAGACAHFLPGWLAIPIGFIALMLAWGGWTQMREASVEEKEEKTKLRKINPSREA